MSIQRIVFIRPGETDWNRLGRWQGTVQVPLNSFGAQQAQRLASYLRMIGMAALYTSDLRRAMDTAAILAKELGYAPILETRLRERAVGLWQGLTQAEVREWYPAEYALLQADPEGYAMPNGGESRDQVNTRVRAFLQELLTKETGNTIGILSHTTAIRTMLLDFVKDYSPNDHAYSNSSVTTIEKLGDGTWRTIMIDDISHLLGMETRRFIELEDQRA